MSQQPAAPDPGQSPISHTGTSGPSPRQHNNTSTAVGGSWQQLRDRRREKQQLSCSFCRSRKVKCDRQLPCKTCLSRGIGPSCTYPSTPGGDSGGAQRRNNSSSTTTTSTTNSNNNNNVGVGERIHQLEALVRSLLQQQQQQQQGPAYISPEAVTTPTLTEGQVTSEDTPSRPSPQYTCGVPSHTTSGPAQETSPAAAAAAAEEDRFSACMSHVSLSPSRTASESGSMLQHPHGATYVGNVHWAAVLESISELKDYYEEEEEARMMMAAGTSSYMSQPSPGPRLLYAPVQATRAEILASIPARQVVDRMVTRYFNTQYTVSLPVLHRGRFLREYERFWQEPASASVLWIGLLFSMMALAIHLQVCTDDQPDPDTLARAYFFRERTIHCLHLGQFTRGKEHVLETMLNYMFLELMLCKDADIGLWLVLGMLVQLALSLGYHRDAQHFSKTNNISAFAGEMRRRVWAVVVQMDLRLSSQMGLPRLLKLHQCDTAEPRNLLDTDFDEATVELPPSRPETEVTPVLYVLAKNRIDRVSDLISDYVNMADARDHSYAETIELDRKLQEGEASLPPLFQWQPVTVSQSLMLPPQIIAHRVLLHLSKQRLTIWLHRRYLAPSYTGAEYRYSRNACIQAGLEILQLQKLIDEETQPDGLLYSVRYLVISSLAQFVFLLGMSILSYYLQLVKTQPGTFGQDELGGGGGGEDNMVDQDTQVARIYALLRESHPIWLRSSGVSREARKAAKHLSLLLGLQEQQEEEEEPGVMVGGEDIAEAAASSTSPHSSFITSQDTTMSFDQAPWDAYQATLCGEPGGLTAFAPSFSVDVSMAELFMQNSTDWMNG